MNKKDINQLGSVHSTQSEFEEGVTVLTKYQEVVLGQISTVLKDDYSSFPGQYAPKGLVSILRNQADTKSGYDSINATERRQALNLIRKLELQLELDFSEIEDMPSIIDRIIESENLSKMYYYVSQYDNYPANPNPTSSINKLRFGKNVGKFSVDKVHIDIYNDKVKLHWEAEGAKWHEAPVKHQSSLEERIMNALNAWTDFYHK
ncbi:hypothetical protein [Paenibacillus agri]|uniref:Uncharacterized protein n=1 Tax=Paenibacillus agri TaxID=2744309 RepID=A0A850ECP1_9BACL|nr:hypothetical protein [Paenibacillus agri]NUU58975.1 hypothetical protein [Paenibacillus agri]